MNANTMQEALDAVVEETEKLLQMDLPPEIETRVNLIHFIAESGSDMRTEQETQE